MKTKTVVTMVVLVDVTGEVVTFLGGLANSTGWQMVKFPCECGWAVLAFPLGWLGLVAGLFTRGVGIFHPCLWGGVTLNACLWGWVACWILRSMQGQAGYKGFDASLVSPRIARLRQDYVVPAHSRSKPLHFRKGLLAAAGRALTKFAFFSATPPEREKPEHQEGPRSEP